MCVRVSLRARLYYHVRLWVFMCACMGTCACVRASLQGEETLVIACMVQALSTGAEERHMAGRLCP